MLTANELKQKVGNTTLMKFKKINSDNVMELNCTEDEFIAFASNTGAIFYSFEYYAPREIFMDEKALSDKNIEEMDENSFDDFNANLLEFKEIINKVDLDRPMRLTLACIRGGVWYTLSSEDLWLTKEGSGLTPADIEDLNSLDPEFASGALTTTK